MSATPFANLNRNETVAVALEARALRGDARGHCHDCRRGHDLDDYSLDRRRDEGSQPYPARHSLGNAWRHSDRPDRDRHRRPLGRKKSARASRSDHSRRLPRFGPQS